MSSRPSDALSNAFVAYVGDLMRDPDIGIIYVDAQLRPKPPSPLAALLKPPPRRRSATTSATWAGCIPSTAQLRRRPGRSQLCRRPSARAARAQPPAGARAAGRQAAATSSSMPRSSGSTCTRMAQVVDSMVVVVGKPKYPTPMMTAYIRFASLNPYWYVPPDLAAERIAPNVLKRGLKYLDELGYQVMSDWDDERRPSSTPRRSTGRRSPTARSRCASASCPGRTIRWGG